MLNYQRVYNMKVTWDLSWMKHGPVLLKIGLPIHNPWFITIPRKPAHHIIVRHL